MIGKWITNLLGLNKSKLPGHPRVTLSGKAIEQDDHQAPGPINPLTGQHTDYWVLPPEEIAKGFVRPVRQEYVHVGKKPKYPIKPLTAEQEEKWGGNGFVAFEEYPEGEKSVGRYWKQDELDSGCRTKTTMSLPLAETYARDPGYYGSTMCVGCGDHFPVAEFVWAGTEEVVGS